MKILERVYPDDKKVKPQTLAHHEARYDFAAKLFENKDCFEYRHLDLACGSGYGCERLKKAGFIATGIDISPEAILYARRHYPECVFYVRDIIEPPRFIDSFDLITMFEAIEHLPYLQGVEIIKNYSDLLIKGGYFVLSTPRDINDKYNTFHKSEWDYGLIKNILGSFFSSVKMYGQNWDTAEISDENVRGNDFYVAVASK